MDNGENVKQFKALKTKFLRIAEKETQAYKDILATGTASLAGKVEEIAQNMIWIMSPLWAFRWNQLQQWKA